jgi:DNA polymerase-3 subunit alpha
VLEALIRAGCFDCLGLTRATCTAQLPMALQAADQQLRDVAVGQEDLFGLGGASGSDESVVPPDAPVLPEWDELERLAYEKEVLGLYLTGHPISRYESELGKLVGSRLNGLAATGSEPPPPQKGRRRNNGPKITVAGLVVGLRTRNTQSGSRMAILTLDDRTGRIEAIVFPEAFKQYRHVLSQDAVLVVEGTLDYDDFAGGNRVTVEKVSPIDEARIALAKRLVIKLDEGRVNEDLLGRVQSALETFRGDCPVLVEYRNGQAKAALRLDGQWRVRPSEDLVKRLTGLTDAAAIRIEY